MSKFQKAASQSSSISSLRLAALTLAVGCAVTVGGCGPDQTHSISITGDKNSAIEPKVTSESGAPEKVKKGAPVMKSIKDRAQQ